MTITEHDLAVILRTFWITLKAIQAASEPLEFAAFLTDLQELVKRRLDSGRWNDAANGLVK